MKYFIYQEYGDNKGIGFLVTRTPFDDGIKARKWLQKSELMIERVATPTSINYHVLPQTQPPPEKVTLKAKSFTL